ncbi:MAG: DUF4421 family protein [Bacteroidetes bacterium]|nr:DUF4421 family protein [Bacteroidota bacterium]MBS1972939.1 DUF4421 family protein [Bacteroidota bacterium]
MKRTFLSILTCPVFFASASAQSHLPDHDTTYYKSYQGAIIVRAYLSRKYSVLKLVPGIDLKSMSYHANTVPSLGAGFTYRSLSFSYSRGLNFLKSEDRKGRTDFTDLQLRLYKRKWTIDAVASFSRGYYLSPQGIGKANGEGYYIRRDLGTQIVGLGVYRVLNDKKFSYGAALSQNAWQKKSAGSFLIGAEACYVAANGDSAFIPSLTDSSFAKQGIRKFHLFEIGPSLGYAYLLVIAHNYFVLGSFNLGLNYSYSREIGNSRGTKIGAWGNYIFRLAAGYNATRWNLGLAWLGARINTEGRTSAYKYLFDAGGYRLIYARRFAIGYKMKQILE